METADKWIFPAFRAFVLKSTSSSASSGSSDGTPESSHATAALHTASSSASIPWEVEQQLRRTTCSFVEDLASIVEIPDAPAIAAQLYVQRFYMLHSFHKHDRFLLATAALFLAAKTEEFPIKVRLLTECALYLLVCKQPDKDELMKKSRNPHPHRPHDRNSSGSGRSFPPSNKRKNSSGKPVEISGSLGNDPEAANARHLDCLHSLLEVIDVGEVEATASKVLLLERILLQTISFDLGIPQPFAYVSRSMENVFALEAMHPSIPYATIRELAFLLLADAIKSGLCLAFNSVELAAGAVYLSCLYRCSVSPNVATDTNAPWWSLLGLSSQQLKGKESRRSVCLWSVDACNVTDACVMLFADVARGFLWMYEDASGQKRPGLSVEFQHLWERYRPEQNMPDLEYIKKLDADLQSPQ